MREEEEGNNGRGGEEEDKELTRRLRSVQLQLEEYLNN